MVSSPHEPLLDDSRPHAAVAASLISALDSWAFRAGDRVAYRFLQDDGRVAAELTFRTLALHARALSQRLLARLCPGDAVVLALHPGPDYIVSFLACLYARLVAVPAYPGDSLRVAGHNARLRGIVRDSGARLALCPTRASAQSLHDSDDAVCRWVSLDELASWDAAMPAAVPRAAEHAPEDLAFLQYTSGSTGTPKGVMVTHGNLIANAAALDAAFAMPDGGCLVTWLPPYHDMGLILGLLQGVYGGFCTIAMSPFSFLKNPARWLQAISDYAAVVSGAPDFAYSACVERIPEKQRARFDLRTWRCAFTGAEMVRARTLERFSKAFAVAGFRRDSFFPAFGLAEATLFVAGGRRNGLVSAGTFERSALQRGAARWETEREAQQIVGYPIAENATCVRVIDPTTCLPVRDGMIGEVWISGPSVASGYWKRPQESQATFGAQIPGEAAHYLRTGDLGFRLDDVLYLTGRAKDLIIVRGQNHYPEDIESTALQSNADLEKSGGAAAFGTERDDEEQLVVVLEAPRRANVDASKACADVFEAVARRHGVTPLEVMMVPPRSLPRTSSGKLQRRTCKAFYEQHELQPVARLSLDDVRARDGATRAAVGAAGDRPDATAHEQRFLAQVRSAAADILQMTLVAIQPDVPLTTLGLDSLSGAELCAHLEETLHVELQSWAVMRYPTAQDLAAHIETLSRDRASSVLLDVPSNVIEEPAVTAIPAIQARSSHDGPQRADRTPARKHPLGPAQRDVWRVSQYQRKSPRLNILGVHVLRGRLDPDALELAIQRMFTHQEVLRTQAERAPDGTPIQVVAPQAPSLVRIDGTAIAEEHWAEEIQRRGQDELWTGVDLECDPLFSAKLLRLSPVVHVLFRRSHRFIADGWTLRLIDLETADHYNALVSRSPSSELATPGSYGELVRSLQNRQPESLERSLRTYWAERLRGCEGLLPALSDHETQPFAVHQGGHVAFELDAALVVSLRHLAKVQGSTLFMVLLTAYKLALKQHSGRDDVVLVCPTANRERRATHSVMGPFANLVAIRTDLAGTPSFVDALRRVQASALDSFAHQGLACGDAIEAAFGSHALETRIADVMFSFVSLPLPRARLEQLVLETVRIERSPAKVDLGLWIWEREGHYICDFEYSGGAFDRLTIEGLARSFAEALESLHRL